MSVRRLAEIQPESFAFTQDNLQWAEGQIAKYPEGRQASAVIPLLWKAQEQHGGWLPEPAIRAIAEMLGMPTIRVMEVATFYTMFNLSPVGEHFVQLCGTTPCALRGANALKDVCRKVIGDERHVTADGKLSWLEVECLGACSNAPMVQINYDYYEDLTPESFEALLADLRAGRSVTPGSQIGRSCSAPEGGDTSLTDETLYDGSAVGAWKKRFEEHGAPDPGGEPDRAGRPGEKSRPEAKAAPAGDADAKPEAGGAQDRSRREGQPEGGSAQAGSRPAQDRVKSDSASGSPTVGPSPSKPAEPGVAPTKDRGGDA
jgi:NADH-quinone oxidoreductase subunit E